MSTGRAGQRRLAALAGVAVAANLAVAAGYAALHDGGHGRAAAPRSAPVAGNLQAPGQAVVAGLLRRRSRAVLTHDKAAFLATVDPSGQAFRAGQQVLFDNLSKLPLASWSETLADTKPAVVSDDGWTARLRMTYRLRGYDRRDVTSTQYLTFDQSPGAGWVISGDGASRGLRDDAQIFNSGVLTVVRGQHTLVLSDGDRRADLRDVAHRLDQAVGTVSGVVGDRWARKVVALVPATEQQAADLVGDVRNLGDIAALATVTGDDGDPGKGEDRVVIAPAAFGRLNGLGRHVVLTHELTHVATGGARDSTTPMWLIEGLADYVGYKDVGVSVKSAAHELADAIARGDVPTGLPDREAFAGSGGKLSAAYEEAWLACRMIADHYGENTLVRLYRTAQSESGETGDPRIEDDALRKVLHVGTGAFATQWRAYIHAQLG